MPMRVFRLEEDKTGINPNNLVPNEEHLLPATGVRYIVTKRGPFYSASVKVIDAVTGKPLIPRLDFDCIQLEVEQTQISGKEVCSIIVIRNEAVSGKILVTYQAYGGWLSYSVTAIIEMVRALDLDIREITWGQIVGIPDRLPAAPHRHPLSDVYGWHKLFPGLGAIRDAIITGNQPLLDQFREGIQRELDELEENIGLLRSQIIDHVNQTGNVHQLHIHQISGYLQSEVDDRLLTKLGKEETAVNANRVYGQSRPELLAWLHQNLRNDLIVIGQVKKENRAEGLVANVTDQVVTSEGYQKFTDLLNRHMDTSRSAGIYWAGDVRAADARLLYADNTRYPAPILVGHSYYRSWVVGTGNGSVTQYDISRGIQYKSGPGTWINFVSY